ncbi:phage tail protein [Marinobacter nauticus]|uniref:phage tail protein n=1 Tax=Marinobacter nauticus TaxID=2743 RepID=UPI001C99D141|nr:phage tail protein [Marinobacter nauticus]
MVDVLPDIGRHPDYGLSRSTQHNVTRVRFGDGYEQRRPTGINPSTRVYNVTWSLLDQEEYDILYDFLASRKGVYSFIWTVPDTGEQVRVVADDISDQYTGYKTYTVTCTLREVHEK